MAIFYGKKLELNDIFIALYLNYKSKNNLKNDLKNDLKGYAF